MGLAKAGARPGGAVDVDIEKREGYLYVAVADRGGPSDAREVLQKVIAAAQANLERRLLISVRRSDAIFKVEEYGLSDAIMRFAGVPGLRIAMVGDSPELFASYQYVEVLAMQKGLAARAFRAEREAIRWLLE
jgi:hypothetical protein